MPLPLLDYQLDDIRYLLETAMEGCDGEFRFLPRQELIELVDKITAIVLTSRSPKEFHGHSPNQA